MANKVIFWIMIAAYLINILLLLIIYLLSRKLKKLTNDSNSIFIGYVYLYIPHAIFLTWAIIQMAKMY